MAQAGPRDSQGLVSSTAFLTAVLQDYGRAHGISTDALTFTHRVVPETIGSMEEEFSIMVQKKLNLVRRAFKVPDAQRRHTSTPTVTSCPASLLTHQHGPGAGSTNRAPTGPFILSLREPSLERGLGARCPCHSEQTVPSGGTTPAPLPSTQWGEQLPSKPTWRHPRIGAAASFLLNAIYRHLV